MEFLITEAQLKIILEEQGNSKLTDNMKTLYSFTTNMVNRVMKVYKLNLKMLLTWGTSVGGMMMPLDNFIRNGNFEMTDDQRMLVLSGVIFILFFEGKRGLSKILETIKKEKLDEEFEVILDKAFQLKSAFQGFLETVKVSSSVFLDIVAYGFLLPIIPDFFEIIRGTKDLKEASILIAERLIASGVVSVSKDMLVTTIRKILKKFK